MDNQDDREQLAIGRPFDKINETAKILYRNGSSVVILGTLRAGYWGIHFFGLFTTEVVGFIGLFLILYGLGVNILKYLREPSNVRIMPKTFNVGLGPISLGGIFDSSAEVLGAAEKEGVLTGEQLAQTSHTLLEEGKESLRGLISEEMRVLLAGRLSLAEDGENRLLGRTLALQELRQRMNRTQDRLHDEIRFQVQRGNLNLMIGSLTTLAAVALLAYVVFNSSLKTTDWKELLPAQALRISIVVIIQIFSYFFLKMYRASLLEIKYFQNELTNIDAKYVSLESALLLNKEDFVKPIIVSMIATERNFVLKRGESTVELERLKAENSTLKDAMSSLKETVVKIAKTK